MFRVTCEDGQSRHDAPFATRQEADQFAWWGHVCTAKHTITVECIVDGSVDQYTYDDCICPTCRRMQREANEAMQDAGRARRVVVMNEDRQATLDRISKMTARVFAWLDKLDAISPEGYAFTCDTPGKRFVRIVMSINGKHNSVHAFYDINTGDVLKAAGWKAPAKGIRYNLLDDESFARMLDVCDWSGGYLYIR